MGEQPGIFRWQKDDTARQNEREMEQESLKMAAWLIVRKSA